MNIEDKLLKLSVFADREHEFFITEDAVAQLINQIGRVSRGIQVERPADARKRGR